MPNVVVVYLIMIHPFMTIAHFADTRFVWALAFVLVILVNIYSFSAYSSIYINYVPYFFCSQSGGPLVFKDKLIGITSWAYLCARGLPDGFCRISQYVDWIEGHVNSTGTEPLP